MDSSEKVNIKTRLKTFPGGIHPREFGEGKAATNGKPSQPANAPGQVAISMSQHIGAPCACLVKPGDRVLKGQKLGEPKGFMGAPVHSSVSGTVKAIENRPMANGMNAQCVIIDNDMQDEWDPSIVPPANADSMSHSELIDYIREKGIVGLGGAAFPTSIKLAPPADKPIDYVIINGAECEPFLTSDHRMLLEHPEDILEGLQWAMKITGAKHGVIAIEDNKPDAIAVMDKLVAGTPFKVVPLRTKYPQGGEKELIQAVTSSESPSERLIMWWPWYRKAEKDARIEQLRAEAEARGETYVPDKNRFVETTSELFGKAKVGIVKAKDGVVKAASNIKKKEPAAPQLDEDGNPIPQPEKEPLKIGEKAGELFGKAKDGLVKAKDGVVKVASNMKKEPAAPQLDEDGNPIPQPEKEPGKFAEKTGELFGKAKDGLVKAKDGVVKAASNIKKKEPAAPQLDEDGNPIPQPEKEPSKFVEKTGELFGKAKTGVVGAIDKLKKKPEGESSDGPTAWIGKKQPNRFVEKTGELFGKAKTGVTGFFKGIAAKLKKKDEPASEKRDSGEFWKKASSDLGKLDGSAQDTTESSEVAQPAQSPEQPNLWAKAKASIANRSADKPAASDESAQAESDKTGFAEKASSLWGRAKGGLSKLGKREGQDESAPSNGADKPSAMSGFGDKMKEVGGSVGGWFGGLKDKATDAMGKLKKSDETEPEQSDAGESDESTLETVAEETMVTPIDETGVIEDAQEQAEDTVNEYADKHADTMPPYGKKQDGYTGNRYNKNNRRGSGKGDEQPASDETAPQVKPQASEPAPAPATPVEQPAEQPEQPEKPERKFAFKLPELAKKGKVAASTFDADKPATGSEFADKAKLAAKGAGEKLRVVGKKSGKVIAQKSKEIYGIVKTKVSFKYDDDGNVDERPYFRRMFSHMHKLNEMMCDGRQVPSGKLPMDAGCVVLNVSTAAAIARAMRTGQPITERVVTVTGDVEMPANLKAPIGTPVGELIEQCGGLSSDVVKVVAGGPMMGLALSSESTPVVKATGGLLVISKEHAPDTPESACIRCGKCVEACPIGLLPQRLNELAIHDRIDQCDALHAMDCIECGCCSYVCPAKRHLTQSIRMAKREITKRKKAKK